jgi:hypothetical protein
VKSAGPGGQKNTKLRAQIKNYGSSPRDQFGSVGMRSMGDNSDAEGNYLTGPSLGNLQGKYGFGASNPANGAQNDGPMSGPNGAGLKVTSGITKGTQTESDIFFEYILEFLRIVEERINSGEIAAEHLVPWDHPDSDYQRLEAEIRKSQEKLNELQQILGRIASLRNKGGDVFFRGLAKVF